MPRIGNHRADINGKNMHRFNCVLLIWKDSEQIKNDVLCTKAKVCNKGPCSSCLIRYKFLLKNSFVEI